MFRLSCVPLQYKSYLHHCLSLTAKTETNELKLPLTMAQLWYCTFTTFSIFTLPDSLHLVHHWTTSQPDTLSRFRWKTYVIVTRQKMYKWMDVFYRHTKITHIPTCCSPELDQSRICPHPTSWRFSLIISFYLHHVFSVLFSSGFPAKTLYTLLLSSMCATWPAHFLIFDLIT